MAHNCRAYSSPGFDQAMAEPDAGEAPSSSRAPAASRDAATGLKTFL